jgi:hypothetical protein
MDMKSTLTSERVLADLAVLDDDLEILGRSAIGLIFSSGLPSTGKPRNDAYLIVPANGDADTRSA